jgi:hypothetical protein
VRPISKIDVALHRKRYAMRQIVTYSLYHQAQQR